MQLSLIGAEKLLRSSCHYHFLLTLATVMGNNRKRSIAHFMTKPYVRSVIYHSVNVAKS